MKNGGFSITSWPTLTMQSAFSTARWTKSPSESVALPIHSGCSSSITPLPIWVVKNGIPVLSTNSRNIRAEVLRLAPAPTIRIGRLAARIASTARATALSSATGRRW